MLGRPRRKRGPAFFVGRLGERPLADRQGVAQAHANATRAETDNDLRMAAAERIHRNAGDFGGLLPRDYALQFKVWRKVSLAIREGHSLVSKARGCVLGTEMAWGECLINMPKINNSRHFSYRD
jgi:hypothetical protein